MKKTFAGRLLAVAVMTCMILTMALPVSALEKYTLTLEMTEAKATGRDGITTVVAENGSVTMGESLTTALLALVVGDGQIGKSGLWAFESQSMERIMVEGLLAYTADDDGVLLVKATVDVYPDYVYANYDWRERFKNTRYPRHGIPWWADKYPWHKYL